MQELFFPKKFYITTPIYYVNGKFHLGHAYTTVIADVFARYFRLLGSDVFFLTGTDEHGLKVQQSAEKENKPIQVFLDDLVKSAKDTWELLDISYDFFIRTTDVSHKKILQEITYELFKKGDIYKGVYKGYYCRECESFYKEKDIVSNKCAYGHSVVLENEDAYFFKLSKYQEWLREYILNTPEFLLPLSRRNEILSFLNTGLEDLCISRLKSKVSWGIELPFDNEHTLYVWMDALFNYYTALCISHKDNFKKYWPPDFQLMAKEIFRFHAVYWPIFLKSYGLEIPVTEFAHGWYLVESQKMSKSLNNVVYPEEYIKEYGSDAFRYYIIKQISFGEDGSFSKRAFIETINSDLLSNIGNLFSRVLTLAEKHGSSFDFYADSFSKVVEEKLHTINDLYKKHQLSKVLTELLHFSDFLNKFVQENKPWDLFNTDKQRYKQVMYFLLESLRLLALELSPILTKKWKEMFMQLGLDADNLSHKKLAYTSIMEGKLPKKLSHLFKKIDS